MSSDLVAIENRLWAAADQLWANTGLKPSEFSTPVLGLIFLRYADKRFTELTQALHAKGIPADEREPMDYQAEGVLYLPEEARFSHLLTLTEGANLGKAIATAMALVEEHNPELKGVLPRGYNLLPNATLVELLRLLAPLDLEGDAFGKVYEYFLGNFALKEGQKGGEFFTPTSIVRLIVEIMRALPRPHLRPRLRLGRHVRAVAPPSCSATTRAPTRELTVFGTEKASDTVKLAKMNLAVHGLSGDIREANTYYEDPHKAAGPVRLRDGQSAVQRLRRGQGPAEGRPRASRSACRRRTTPTTCGSSSSASSLNENGRAGFVMANSAGDARGSELEIRKKLIQSGAVDVIVSIGSNFFYTVTLPCTLWFFDRAKATRAAQGQGAVPGRAAVLQAGEPRASASSRPSRWSSWPTSCGCTAARRRSSSEAARRCWPSEFPAAAYADVAGPVQGGDAGRDRGAGLEPESRALRGRRRARQRTSSTSSSGWRS